MKNEELTKKLAERAGFKLLDTQFYEHSFGSAAEVETWQHPNGISTQIGEPDLTQSLDACFKWLKPMVIAKGEGAILTWRRVLNDWLKIMAEEKAMDDAPALALCLVIEKLTSEETR